MGELGAGGGFAGAVDADDGNDGGSFGGAAQCRGVGGQGLLHFVAGDGEDVHACAALGFVALFYRSDDLMGHGEAEIGAEQRGFEFLERGAGQLGRSADDAFDFVDQPAVSLVQAGFELVE